MAALADVLVCQAAALRTGDGLCDCAHERCLPTQGGRDAHKGAPAGYGSGEGPSAGAAVMHTVKILNRQAGQELEVQVPEDRYAAATRAHLCSPGRRVDLLFMALLVAT